jgi:hypothetical protein
MTKNREIYGDVKQIKSAKTIKAKTKQRKHVVSKKKPVEKNFSFIEELTETHLNQMLVSNLLILILGILLGAFFI